MKTETITPKTRYSRSGTITNQMNEEINSANSQRNDEKISKMILMGESEIVKINIASGIPKARKAQPKNSATVMLVALLLFCLRNVNNTRNSLIRFIFRFYDSPHHFLPQLTRNSFAS